MSRRPLALLFLSAACGGAPFTTESSLLAEGAVEAEGDANAPADSAAAFGGEGAVREGGGEDHPSIEIDTGVRPDAGGVEASRDASPDAPAEGAPPDAPEDSPVVMIDAPVACNALGCPGCGFNMSHCCTSPYGHCGCTSTGAVCQ